MKLLLDFLPLILFFGTFKFAESDAEGSARFASEHFGFLVSGGTFAADSAPVLLATVVVIVATLVQVGILLLMRRKVDTMLWVTFALVTILGGATIWLQNPTFIKWKPSVLYWVMALVFWASSAFFGKNLLRTLMGSQMDLPAQIWQRLNLAWVLFFIAMGGLNLWVAYNFSTSFWATFKVFGLSALLLLFMLVQGFFIVRHIREDEVVAAPVSDQKEA